MKKNKNIYHNLKIILSLCVFSHIHLSAYAVDDSAGLSAQEVKEKKYPHKDNYGSANNQSWGSRDGIEIEATFGVFDCPNDADPSSSEPNKLDRIRLFKYLFNHNGNMDWEAFRDLRDCSSCEAFTSGYNINEMPWDKKSHEVREKNPYVWITIEGGRYESENREPRKLSLGNDLMDDYYYDFKYPIKNGETSLSSGEEKMTLRGRKRWDSWKHSDPASLRRLIVAVKTNYGIDPELGLKKAGKIDSRESVYSVNDSSVVHLTQNIPTGFWDANWDGNNNSNLVNSPLKAMETIYQKYSDKLPDIEGTMVDSADGTTTTPVKYENVLAVEPKAFIRSLRSRFHYNETDMYNVYKLFQNGENKLNSMRQIIKNRIAELNMLNHGASVGNHSAQTYEISYKSELEIAKNNFDWQALKENAQALTLEKLQNTSTTDTPPGVDLEKFWPTDSNVDSRLFGSEADSRIAELYLKTLSEVLHKQGEALRKDSFLHSLLGVVDFPSEEGAQWFRLWTKDNPSSHGLSMSVQLDKVYDQFLTAYEEKKKADFDQMVSDFNSFAKAQKDSGNEDFENFVNVDKEDFDKTIGNSLKYQVYKTWSYQIEASGSAAIGIWYNWARMYYVPNSHRAYGNMYIDTLDISGIYKVNAWENAGVPLEKQTNESHPDLESLLTSTLVNEVQIELELEEVYITRIKELETELKQKKERLLDLQQSQQAPTLPATNSSDATVLTATDNSDSDEIANLEKEIQQTKEKLKGANDIFGQHKILMKDIASAKGKSILKKLKKYHERAKDNNPDESFYTGERNRDFKDDICWQEAKQSKGELALKTVSQSQSGDSQ